MTTSQKVLIGAAAAAVIVGGVAIGLTVSRTPDKLDLSTIHTEAAEETMASSSETPETTPPETMESTEQTETGADGFMNIPDGIEDELPFS